MYLLVVRFSYNDLKTTTSLKVHSRPSNVKHALSGVLATCNANTSSIDASLRLNCFTEKSSFINR